MNGVAKCSFHMEVKPLFMHYTNIRGGGGIRNNTNYTLLSTISDPLGHFITLKVQINDKVYVVVNIYAPNKDKDLIQFFKKSSGLL